MNNSKNLHKKIALIYIGGGDWLPGVPARDLTIEEIEGLDVDHLIKSGLYKEPETEIELIPKKHKLED
jgi:hypothetical protein